MCPFVLAPPGTVDVVSPWELQLENQPVYKYANVPRGAAYLYFCDMTCCLPCIRHRYSFFAAVLFGVVTNGEAIAAAANEAHGSKITHVLVLLPRMRAF